jgi:hypothetical protein
LAALLTSGWMKTRQQPGGVAGEVASLLLLLRMENCSR